MLGVRLALLIGFVVMFATIAVKLVAVAIREHWEVMDIMVPISILVEVIVFCVYTIFCSIKGYI